MKEIIGYIICLISIIYLGFLCDYYGIPIGILAILMCLYAAAFYCLAIPPKRKRRKKKEVIKL